MSERRARLAEELWKTMEEEDAWDEMTAPEDAARGGTLPALEPKSDQIPAPKSGVIKRGKPRKEDDTSYKPPKEQNASDDKESSQRWDESDLSESAMRELPKKSSQTVPKKAPVKKRPRHEDPSYKPIDDTGSSEEEEDAKEANVTKRRRIQGSRRAMSLTAQDTAKSRKGQRSHGIRTSATPTPAPRNEAMQAKAPGPEELSEIGKQVLHQRDKVAYPKSPIPGFADLFTPTFVDEPPPVVSLDEQTPGSHKKQTPSSYKQQTPGTHEKSTLHGADTKRASSLSGPKTPGPLQGSTSLSSVPLLSTSKKYGTSSNGDQIGDSARDWPPYPGTIYCEHCFRHDCLRAIRLRHNTFLILNIMGKDVYLAHFIWTIKLTVATKRSDISTPTEKAFFEQLPPDLISLIALRRTVAQWWGPEECQKNPTRGTKQANAQIIIAALERMYRILNLSETSIHQIEKKFQSSLSATARKLDESQLPSVSPAAIEPYVTKIRHALYLQLGITMTPTPDKQDTLLWEQNFFQSIGDSTTRALRRISSSNASTAAAPSGSGSSSTSSFSNVLPYLHCTYCLQSGASNKMLATRPYPRDMAQDAARPWTQALQLSFPWIHDENPNPSRAPNPSSNASKKTNLITALRTKQEDAIKIKSAPEFLASLADRREVEQVTISGLVFLVLRNSQKDGYSATYPTARPPTPHPAATFASSGSSKHGKLGGTRIVLVEMKNVLDEIANGVWWDKDLNKAEEALPSTSAT